MNPLFFPLAILAALTSSAAADRTLVFMYRNMSYGENQEVFFVGSDRYGQPVPIRTFMGNGTLDQGHPRHTQRTTDDMANANHDMHHHPENKFGDDYYLMELDMDCTATSDGWFQLQAYVAVDGVIQELEPNVDQHYRPEDAINNVHFGRCGWVNVFKYGCPDYDWYHVVGNAYKTNIFVQKPNVEYGQNVYLIGGRAGCPMSEGSNCDVGIERMQMLDYNMYSQFDDFTTYINALSWDKVDAYSWSTGLSTTIGMPMARTSNNPGSNFYQPWVASLGDDFFFAQVDMVCSDTSEDYKFAFQAYVTDHMGNVIETEGPINQAHISTNMERLHYGMCADTNIYVFNEDSYSSVWTIYYFKDLIENGPVKRCEDGTCHNA